ncbi:hypothetical protein PYCCODRAFT_361283 [Trametes coccinea BRFM310]|uniref:Uncharacterized protein n=1 Tax=Trametes coccinea (strain BRFM310) TaxID=1353009 RepID=A0A1Y2J390_TRAC3|nr:hypothetical protein PYCCODRAFT_361283 [Trametes coccinea BRFM310]
MQARQEGRCRSNWLDTLLLTTCSGPSTASSIATHHQQKPVLVGEQHGVTRPPHPSPARGGEVFVERRRRYYAQHLHVQFEGLHHTDAFAAFETHTQHIPFRRFPHRGPMVDQRGLTGRCDTSIRRLASDRYRTD